MICRESQAYDQASGTSGENDPIDFYERVSGAGYVMRTWYCVFMTFMATAVACCVPASAKEISGKATAAEIERQLSSFKYVSPKLEGGTDGGGGIAAWLQDGHPRKIVVWVLLSSREVKMTFYFIHDQLIAALRRDRWFAWDASRDQLDPARTDGILETRFTFGADSSVETASCVQDGIFVRDLPDGEASRMQRLADFFEKAVTQQTPVIDAEQVLKSQ